MRERSKRSVFKWWLGTLATGVVCSLAIGGLFAVAWFFASARCWDSC